MFHMIVPLGFSPVGLFDTIYKYTLNLKLITHLFSRLQPYVGVRVSSEHTRFTITAVEKSSENTKYISSIPSGLQFYRNVRM